MSGRGVEAQQRRRGLGASGYRSNLARAKRSKHSFDPTRSLTFGAVTPSVPPAQAQGGGGRSGRQRQRWHRRRRAGRAARSGAQR